MTETSNKMGWAETIGAASVTYMEAMEAIVLCHATKGQVAGLVGASGIGKTDLIRAAAAEICRVYGYDPSQFGYVERVLSVTGPEHIAGFPHFPEDEPGVWRMMHEASLVEEIKKPYGILFFDEANRNNDLSVKNGLFKWLRDYGANGLQLPEGWTVVVAMNPALPGYQVNELESESAFRRSILWMWLESNPAQWLSWAKKNPNRIHQQVRKFVQEDASRLHDKTAQDSGKIGPTPASWEKVSKVLFNYEKLRRHYNHSVGETTVRATIAGAVGVALSAAFMDAYRFKKREDGADAVTSEDVILRYTSNDDIRKAVQKMLSSESIQASSAEEYQKRIAESQENSDEIGRDNKGYIFTLLRATVYSMLVGSYDEHAEKLGIKMPDNDGSADGLRTATTKRNAEIYKVVGKNIAHLMSDMPNELYSAFMAQWKEVLESTEEARPHSVAISGNASQYPAFREKAKEVQSITTAKAIPNK